MAAAVAAVAILRPLAGHLSLRAVAAFWLVVVLGVALPGVALTWCAGFYRNDRALLVGQGVTVGLALHGLAFLATRSLGLAVPPLVFPLSALAAAAALARRRASREAEGRRAAAGTAVLLPVLAGCFIQPLVTVHLLDLPLPADLAYHAGNAAEVRHRWPLQDPRVAGLPLNYPVLSYALPATASQVTGLPVADALHGLSTLFWIGLLALQVHNAARVLLDDTLAATAAALVVLLHQDVGRFLGLGSGAFSSALATAIYGSPTTVCGLILFAALAIVIVEVVSSPARLRALWPLLLLLGAAASLTKATVAPVAVGACALVALRAHRAGRPQVARAALACALVLGAAALPFTLRLGTGDTSYRGILRWDPGAVVRSSPFAQKAGVALGGLPTALLAPAWLAGYLGFAGVAALAFLLRRRQPLSDAHVFALSALAAGAVPALLLDGHGLSQLFFIYNGQLLLAALAGGGVARALRNRRPAVLVALGLAALPALDVAARVLSARVPQDRAAATHELPRDAADYAAGLAWLRAHASSDAIVFADNPSMLLSAFGECRLYYETGLYAARAWEQRWRGWSEPYPDRAAFQETLLRRPSLETLASVRQQFPAPTEVLVVADNVQSSVQAGLLRVEIGPVPARALLPAPWFQPVFANRAMHVYRVARD
jgi:hypothetical protein